MGSNDIINNTLMNIFPLGESVSCLFSWNCWKSCLPQPNIKKGLHGEVRN